MFDNKMVWFVQLHLDAAPAEVKEQTKEAEVDWFAENIATNTSQLATTAQVTPHHILPIPPTHTPTRAHVGSLPVFNSSRDSNKIAISSVFYAKY